MPDPPVVEKVVGISLRPKLNPSREDAVEEQKQIVNNSQPMADDSLDSIGIPLRVRKYFSCCITSFLIVYFSLVTVNFQHINCFVRFCHDANRCCTFMNSEVGT